MVLAVGLKQPKIVEEAQNILDRYNSLRNETKPGQAKPGGADRAKAVWQKANLGRSLQLSQDSRTTNPGQRGKLQSW